MKKEKVIKYILVDLLFVCLGLLKLYSSGETKIGVYVITSIFIFVGMPILFLIFYYFIRILDYILSLFK